MSTTWILIADSSRARIFEKKENEKHLQEIDDFVNAAGRADDSELGTDERGRFYGRGERYQGHTAEPAVSAVEHEDEMFSHTLANYLDDARNARRYSRLYLVAGPKFLGMLHGNLKKEVRELVAGELAKDISIMDVREVENYLHGKLDYFL
ncbi:MAG TPA: host attachment protein [Nitrosospira sp.]|jgi:protein required for attachment to host cells|nr:host attachment protein [Nitrosospira sp.]